MTTPAPFEPQQSTDVTPPAILSAVAPAVVTQPTVQVVVSPKSVGITYVLWLFFGALGVHQFYLGKTGRALSMLFTLGWLTVGLWIDLFTIPRQVRAVNATMGITDKALAR